MKTAIDGGVNFFDTANVYSAGRSEEILGQSLRNLGIPRDQFVLATKVLGRAGPGVNQLGLSRYHIMAALDASLKRLQLDHVDLYQIHGTDPLTPIEETLDALDDCVRAGKVRYLGVSNHAAWHIAKSLGHQRAQGPGALRKHPGLLLHRRARAGARDRAAGQRSAPGHPALEPARRWLSVRQVQTRRAGP